MATGSATALSGQYNYTDLVREMKNNGISTANMSWALKQVASDNNIDNIEELDGSQKVIVSSSIFDEYGEAAAVSSLGVSIPEEVLLPYVGEYFEIVDDSTPLPEVYNNEEYEVADYDEYYSFGSDAFLLPDSDESAKEVTQGINFDEFKTNYAGQFTTNTIENNDEYLQNIFTTFDTNSNEYLNASELAAMFAAMGQSQQNKNDEVDSMPTGREDLLGGNMMMDMDMSSDSFNPQG